MNGAIVNEITAVLDHLRQKAATFGMPHPKGRFKWLNTMQLPYYTEEEEVSSFCCADFERVMANDDDLQELTEGNNYFFYDKYMSDKRGEALFILCEGSHVFHKYKMHCYPSQIV